LRGDFKPLISPLRHQSALVSNYSTSNCLSFLLTVLVCPFSPECLIWLPVMCFWRILLKFKWISVCGFIGHRIFCTEVRQVCRLLECSCFICVDSYLVKYHALWQPDALTDLLECFNYVGSNLSLYKL